MSNDFLLCPCCQEKVTNYHRQGEYAIGCGRIKVSFYVCQKCRCQFGVNTDYVPEQMQIPKKYMWWLPMYDDSSKPFVCEVGYTMIGHGHDKSVFIFPTEEELKKVVDFFRNIDNNCPMLLTSWINNNNEIDTWEWWTNCRIFENKEDALADATKCLKENEMTAENQIPVDANDEEWFTKNKERCEALKRSIKQSDTDDTTPLTSEKLTDI